MDYTAMSWWLDAFWKIGNVAVTAILWFYVWLSNRQRVTITRIEELETAVDERIADLAERLTRSEERLTAMPTHHDLSQIYDLIRTQSDSIGVVSRDVAATSARLGGMCEQLAMIMEILMRDAKRT